MKIRQISRSGRIPEGMVRLDEAIDPDIALRMTWYPIQLHQGIEGSDLVYVYVAKQDKRNYDSPKFQQQYFRETKESEKQLGKDLAHMRKEAEAERRLQQKHEEDQRQAEREESERKRKLESLLELVAKGIPLSSLLAPSAAEKKRRRKKALKAKRKSEVPSLIVPAISSDPVDWKRKKMPNRKKEKLASVLQEVFEVLQENISITVRNPTEIWLQHPLTLDQEKVYLIDRLTARMIRYKKDVYIIVSERGHAHGFGKTLTEWGHLAADNYRNSYLEVVGLNMPLPD